MSLDDLVAEDDLHDRVAELRAWARSRIADCEEISRDGGAYQETLTEARAERRALLAVLRMLDGPRARHATPQAGTNKEKKR